MSRENEMIGAKVPQVGSGRPAGGELLSTRDLTVCYGSNEALHPTSLDFAAGQVTALIGPSGCGKSTFLRCLNLMNREIPKCKIGGEVLYHGRNINTRKENLFELRKSIGMVFQQPTPFRKSIRDNILFAPKRHGLVSGKEDCDALVEQSLRAGALWDEVRDKLDESAYTLSGGQQQRLCIARTLAMHPDVVLLDEPCSALDPISTFTVEENPLHRRVGHLRHHRDAQHGASDARFRQHGVFLRGRYGGDRPYQAPVQPAAGQASARLSDGKVRLII